MSKREEKYQRTPDALTDFDMRTMYIFVWCFFFVFFLRDIPEKNKIKYMLVFPP